MNTENLERFAELLASSKHTVFFGGAGVSTGSGLKDYRSADGLYSTVKEYGVPPETVLSRMFFEKHPDVFWNFYTKYMYSPDARPNGAHKALADLERAGLMDAVITQNIDGLHQAAESRNVLELHGSMSRHYCSVCGAAYQLTEAHAAKGEVPVCPKCGGAVRPDVVLYGEPLDSKVMNEAISAVSQAELLIIGGTSLKVYPAAGLINSFYGDTVVIINKEPTERDGAADMVFYDDIVQVLSAAVDEAIHKR